jgi:hypothetical protein
METNRRSSVRLPHVSSFSSVAKLSASWKGLSKRMRWMRGKRIATPDLWRVERCTLSKATSRTMAGVTSGIGSAA